jgi:hypothetical protein
LYYNCVDDLAQSKYGLKATTYNEYVQSVKANPDKELITWKHLFLDWSLISVMLQQIILQGKKFTILPGPIHVSQ